MQQLHPWISVASDADFSIYNLPFGIFSTDGSHPRIGVAIGNHIVDLAGLAAKKLIDLPEQVASQHTLNAFISLGKAKTSAIRLEIQRMLCDEHSPLRSESQLLVDMAKATMHLPVDIGDYTDFYSSKEHATNVGKMFRDPENALLPNWKHIPVGYHGRASSIIISGQPIHRPKGQVLPKDASIPVFQASDRVDFELEMGFVIGRETQLGESVKVNDAEDYIFGKVLFNDWSARDIQKWEYVPLGPFLAKSFASCISPWIVTMEALEPFRVPGPKQEPQVLPYLDVEGDHNFEIHLEVGITPQAGEEQIVCRSNFKYMYWSMAQQLAHHTVNGCNLRVGDMMASGTISGPEPHQFGSMLELAWAGTKPVEMKDGTTRKFIQDGDTVTMRGYAAGEGYRVGFGEVSNQLLPAK